MLTVATGGNRDINHIAGIQGQESFIMFFIYGIGESA